MSRGLGRAAALRGTLADAMLLTRAGARVARFFRGRPASGVPLVVAWDLNYACDCSCAFCGQDALQKTRKALAVDDAVNVAEKIGRARVGIVNLSGGEPLIAPAFFPVATRLRRFGVRVQLSTNGSRLAEKIDELAQVGLDTITVSLDSLNAERHDAWRGRTGLTEAVEAGLSAVRTDPRFRRTTLRLRYLVTSENVEEIVDFAEKWRGRVDAVGFQPVFVMGPGDIHHFDGSAYVMRSGLREAVREQMTTLMRRYPEYDDGYHRGMESFLFEPTSPPGKGRCLIPVVGMKVTADGRVVSCVDASVIAGDLKTQSVEEIWRGPVFENYRRLSLARKLPCSCWMAPTRINHALPGWAETVLSVGRPAVLAADGERTYSG